jgi:NADH-quinone oxidoreductase subunit L
MVQAILFLPLLGALIAGLFGTNMFKRLGSDAEAYADHNAASHAEDHTHHDHHGHYEGPMWPMYLTTGLLCLCAIMSWIVFWGFLHEGHDTRIELLRWISSGALNASWGIRLDALTAVMLVVVNTVSALVHIYSLGYMSHDEHQPRFFAYLSLFTFAMLALVTSDNLVQMFFGWEGVGLASYLLIGFWYTRETANAAAIKAFVVNRVGDFGYALGIFGVFMIYGSVEFQTIFDNHSLYRP